MQRSLREGWVLDCHLDGDEMATWVKLDDGNTIVQRRKWRVSLHVAADIQRLERLTVWLSQPELHHSFGNLECRFERHLMELGATRTKTVLAVSTDQPNQLKRLAEAIDARGDWIHHELYSVDQKMAQRHLLDLATHPFGRVQIFEEMEKSLVAIDSRTEIEWNMPPLTILNLHVECYDGNGHRTAQAEITKIVLTPRPNLGCDSNSTSTNPNSPASSHCVPNPTFTAHEIEGTPREMLNRLHHLLSEIDPDVIMTTGGDSVDLPALLILAEKAGLPLQLGRSNHDSTPRSRARTAWSYGRLLRKEAYHALQGRLHIDWAGSFIVREGQLAGLLELSRLSGLSAQDLSRLSPGSAISAMQMRQAMEDGVLVPWKKNRPEDVKDGLELLAADRGGLYLEPHVGVHERVVELDFASLFPSIIATRNISPETLNCACCDPSENTGLPTRDGKLPLLVADAAAEVERRLAAEVGGESGRLAIGEGNLERLAEKECELVSYTMQVPELSLHTCTRHHGFLGRVVAPIIERRMYLKAKRERKGDLWDGRQNALKWVLVTCFGYTGYRNARFGRIECHEAICAWSREILLQAIEIANDEGWECLHAIVDSMWLVDLEHRSKSLRGRSIANILEKLMTQVGIPADLEDEYHWICFIPNRTTGVGALTKYFGWGGEGWKVRGIELRQHSTCKWIERLQEESLEILKVAPNEAAQHKVINNLHSQLKLLRGGEIPLTDLVVARRIRREFGDHRVETIGVAALARAALLGRRIAPGNKAKFVVISWRNPTLAERVRLKSEIDAEIDTTHNTSGDPSFYEPLAERAVWAILSPFGWDEEGITRGSLAPLTLDSFVGKSSSDA
uniref:DNA-directed DNA polymerase n=1 Tax=uncultured marine group II/III euryarchaeote KM3_18_D06 TaxID=1457956 RepID=A0A075GVZ7_9EURY|nr:putative DNA-directed DNA polymerase type II (DPA, polB1) [uncultured marine group II/III euryarchaeote KM3_18_D06]